MPKHRNHLFKQLSQANGLSIRMPDWKLDFLGLERLKTSLVFKNCRKYNTDEASDIRVLCDTLREAAILLYRDWHCI